MFNITRRDFTHQAVAGNESPQVCTTRYTSADVLWPTVACSHKGSHQTVRARRSCPLNVRKSVTSRVRTGTRGTDYCGYIKALGMSNVPIFTIPLNTLVLPSRSNGPTVTRRKWVFDRFGERTRGPRDLVRTKNRPEQICVNDEFNWRIMGTSR